MAMREVRVRSRKSRLIKWKWLKLLDRILPTPAVRDLIERGSDGPQIGLLVATRAYET
jgi:hypothetical protein